MRRASKILTLILVVVFLFGIFAGCDLIGKDVAKYRSATAFNVGGQNVTVGKLLDTFNTYYNNYYYYISAGYFATEDVFDMAVESLVTQYMKVDAYTKEASNKVSPNNAGVFANAEYLEQYQLDYSISYVKYLIFTSFDSSVMEKIEAKYDLKDEEAEDTSRDFYKPDDLKGAASYADYYRDKNFTNEDMDEYIEKYFGDDGVDKVKSSDVSDLLSLYKESAQKKVDELNERLDKDEEDDDTVIDKSEYEKYQEAVYKQYETTIKNNYAIEFKEFVKSQIEDMIVSSIINLYNYSVYSSIEVDDDNTMSTLLTNNYNTLRDAQKAEFEISKNYESFVESLSDSSFIFDVPDGRGQDYVFVKNILIPFSASQTAKLASLKADLGTTKDKDGLYAKYRNKLATEIVADDFTSEKDEDGKYKTTVKDLFEVEGDKVVIKSTCAELSALKDGKVNAADGKEKIDVIRELMEKYNSDVAQHSALYSYVVRVNAPKTYKHRWVDEFVKATEDALAVAKENGSEENPEGYYGIGVSDYGVHIVYVEGYVKAIEQPNFTAQRWLDTTTTEYRLFKSYFETQSSKLLSEKLDELKKEYLEKGLISETPVFKKFLKENKMDFNLVERLKNED